MEQAEFENGVLGLVRSQGKDRLTPADVGYGLRIPAKDAERMLDRMVTSGRLELDADDDGNLFYFVPGHGRAGVFTAGLPGAAPSAATPDDGPSYGAQTPEGGGYGAPTPYSPPRPQGPATIGYGGAGAAPYAAPPPGYPPPGASHYGSPVAGPTAGYPPTGYPSPGYSPSAPAPYGAPSAPPPYGAPSAPPPYGVPAAPPPYGAPTAPPPYGAPTAPPPYGAPTYGAPPAPAYGAPRGGYPGAPSTAWGAAPLAPPPAGAYVPPGLGLGPRPAQPGYGNGALVPYSGPPTPMYRNPVAASLLSIMPGTGQLYNGETGKGLMYFLTSCLVATTVPFLMPTVMLFAAVDGYTSARRHNRRVAQQQAAAYPQLPPAPPGP